MEGQSGAHYDIDHGGRSALLLTGGASRRMGFDKASIAIDGEPLSLRLARILRDTGWEPTILGRTPLDGTKFQPDVEIERGPLHALRNYEPTTPLIFVLSCDIPLFDGKMCRVLESQIGENEAAIPSLDGRLQPLCGLYRRKAWQALREAHSSRIMDWIGELQVEVVSEPDLVRLGAHPDWCRGVNTPQELTSLMESPRWAAE